MGDEVKPCEICGRELSGRRDPLKYPDQCWRGLNSSATRECFERGYQRLTEALAAARRVLLEISAGNLDGESPADFQERACDVARTALAAPAAGEEGKR